MDANQHYGAMALVDGAGNISRIQLVRQGHVYADAAPSPGLHWVRLEDTRPLRQRCGDLAIECDRLQARVRELENALAVAQREAAQARRDRDADTDLRFTVIEAATRLKKISDVDDAMERGDDRLNTQALVAVLGLVREHILLKEQLSLTGARLGVVRAEADAMKAELATRQEPVTTIKFDGGGIEVVGDYGARNGMDALVLRPGATVRLRARPMNLLVGAGVAFNGESSSSLRNVFVGHGSTHKVEVDADAVSRRVLAEARRLLEAAAK